MGFTEVVQTVEGEIEGRGSLYITSYTVNHQNDSRIKMGSDVSHFNVSMIIAGQSHETVHVHKPQFVKRKVSRIGESNLRPSAYQPFGTLPPGQAGSPCSACREVEFMYLVFIACQVELS